MEFFKKKFFTEGITVVYFIKINNAFEGIKKYTRKIDANLIIMGSKGHSEFEEIMIGSNTEKVLRISKIPVIAVKRDSKKFKLKNLVFALNFKNENKKVFSKFLEFANAIDSRIHLLKINTPSGFESTQSAEENLKDFIKGFHLPKHPLHIYNDVSVEKGIINFSRDKKVDLIAFNTHLRSSLFHTYLQQVLPKNYLKKL